MAAIVFSSCQKDLDVFVSNPGQLAGPDTTWFNSITNSMPAVTLKNRLMLNNHRDSFLLNANSITIHTGTGLQLTMSGGSILNTANIPVFGKIYIETHLLKKKGEMVRMGTPTTSNNKMLVSGGEFFIRIYNDSSELHLAQNSPIYIKYFDSPTSPLMTLFNGNITTNYTFNWLPNMDTLNNRVYALNQSYEIISNRLGWINCDYFYDTTGIQRTAVSAVLPAHFTNANTVAYTVFNELRSVIGMYGNEVSRKFSTGLLPVNKQITVIVISKQGDDYYLGHEQRITLPAPSGTIANQPVPVTPIKTSLENILAYLNTI